MLTGFDVQTTPSGTGLKFEWYSIPGSHVQVYIFFLTWEKKNETDKLKETKGKKFLWFLNPKMKAIKPSPLAVKETGQRKHKGRMGNEWREKKQTQSWGMER